MTTNLELTEGDIEKLLGNPESWDKELFEKPEARRYIQGKFQNVWWRLNNLYKIRDESGDLVQFKLRPLQKAFLKALHGRDLLLKARQGGFTTVIDIYFLDRAIFNKSTHVGISAHKREDAEKIFREKILTPYENLPEAVRSQVVAEIGRAGEIQFSNKSLVRVAVSLRSGTYQCVHISEYGSLSANQPKRADEVKTGTLNTAHEGSIVVIESTAEGASGEYYRMAQASMKRSGDPAPLMWNEWKFHFSAWWQDPKYTLTAPDDWDEPDEQIEYFRHVEMGMGVEISRDRRYWYCIKSREQGQKMKQEFPSTPEEAFLHSGQGVFDKNKLTSLKQECYNPCARYKVMPSGKMIFDIRGSLMIFEPPKQGKVYGAGADVAEGLAHLENSDSSSLDILDQYGNQVAQYNGKVSPAFFGVICNAVGRYYNNAYLAVERNNHGHAVLLKLSELKYTNLYAEEKISQKTKQKTKRLGWGTNSASKTLMIDHLMEDVEDDAITIASEQTLFEMFTYVVDDKGSFNALPGSHDDRVISLALANQMRRRVTLRARNMDAVQAASNAGAHVAADTTAGY